MKEVDFSGIEDGTAAADPKAVADDALLSIDCAATSYDAWKNICISYKSAGGDLDTFLRWCGSDPSRYSEKEAARLFESVSADGKTGPGTLFFYARQAGWHSPAVRGSLPATPTDQGAAPLDLPPVEQMVTQIEALFDPGDQVNVAVKARFDEKRGKWQPADGGTCYERDELVSLLRRPGFGGVFEGYVSEAGAWVCQNATDGTGRGKGRIRRWRTALVESDDMPVDEQIRIMRELDLPIATMTTSGSKSVHALVRVDAEGPQHYAERVARLHDACNAAGLKVDQANKDSGRLTRLAGVRRGGQVQTLLYTDIGARDFATWEAARRPITPEQGDDARSSGETGGWTFDQLFKPLPREREELPPVLIENTFRKAAVMLIGAAPKVGKSFLGCRMVVAFATGTGLLDFEFAQCERILVVNSEMGKAEYTNRLIDACMGQAVVEEVSKRVWVANTDAYPELDVIQIADLVCSSGFRPDVVLIDPIYPLVFGDENKNDDSRKTLGALKRIASSTGAGVIYMHHFSKGPQDMKEARDRVSGSGVLGRSYAAMWAMTELEPDEDVMRSFGDGAVAIRFSTDMRSFERSKRNRNLDFNAVRIGGNFLRDENGTLDKAPTKESARRAKNSSQAAAKERKVEFARRKIKELLDKNNGEPVPFESAVPATKVSSNTLTNYLCEMQDYKLVKLKVHGKGQKRNHIAWMTWQEPFDFEEGDDHDQGEE
jgi:RecA-family ATPase